MQLSCGLNIFASFGEWSTKKWRAYREKRRLRRLSRSRDVSDGNSPPTKTGSTPQQAAEDKGVAGNGKTASARNSDKKFFRGRLTSRNRVSPMMKTDSLARQESHEIVKMETAIVPPVFHQSPTNSPNGKDIDGEAAICAARSPSPKEDEKTNAPPSKEPIEDSPPLKEPIEDSPPLKEPIEDSPPLKEPAEDSPPLKKSVEDSSPLKEPIEDSPPLKEPAEDSPPLKEPVEDSPPLKEPAEDSPPLKEPVEDSPPLKEPIKKSPPSKEPIKKSAPSKEPIKKSAPSKKPIKKSPPSKKPTKNSPPTKEQIKKSPPSKEPIKKSAPSKEPIKKSAPSKKPIKKSPPSKKPTKNSPPTKEQIKKSPPSKELIKKSAPSKKPIENSPPTKEPKEDSPPSKEPIENSSLAKKTIQDVFPSFPLNRTADIQRKLRSTLPPFNFKTGSLMMTVSVDNLNRPSSGNKRMWTLPKRSMSMDDYRKLAEPKKSFAVPTRQVSIRSRMTAIKRLSYSNPILSRNPYLADEYQRYSFSSGYKSVGSNHSLSSSLVSMLGIYRDHFPQRVPEGSSFRSLNSTHLSIPEFSSSSSDNWDGSVSKNSFYSDNFVAGVTRTIVRSTTCSLTSTTTDSGSSRSSELSATCVFSIMNVPLGLKNPSNVCYMNSVLQCLAHTQPLTNYFLTAHEDTFEVHSLKVYQKFVRKLWQDTTLTCFEPRRLRTVFSSSTFYIGSGQQDAPEFLDFFLQKLHDAMNNPETSIHAVDDNSNSNDPNKLAIVAWSKKLSMDYSFVSELFMGQLRSTLTCAKCSNESYSFDPFWSLSLPLPSQKHESVTIYDCLDEYTMEEKLQGNEMTLCSSCSSKQKSIKTLKIQRFPKILVLHLKRFSYVNGHKDTKLSTGVNFSEELHVTSASANPNDKAVYQLYGYIDHHGTSNFGHYIATCKHINTGCWHSISDTDVSPVHGIETSSSNLVYVLFYQKM